MINIVHGIYHFFSTFRTMGFVEFIKRLSNKSSTTTSDDSMSSSASGRRTIMDRFRKVRRNSRVIKQSIPSYRRREGGLGKLIHEVNQCDEIPLLEKGLIAMMLGEAWYETANTKENKHEVFESHIKNILDGYLAWPVKYDALKQILGRIE
jgi:hypothetical protein